MSLRLAFMGSPAFSVPTLEAILRAGHDVACVYSQPPRPAGRGKQLTRTAVHEAAEQRSVIFIAHENNHGRVRPRKVFDAVGLTAQGPASISNHERASARRAPTGTRPPVVKRYSGHRQAGIEIRESATNCSQ